MAKPSTAIKFTLTIRLFAKSCSRLGLLSPSEYIDLSSADPKAVFTRFATKMIRKASRVEPHNETLPDRRTSR